MVQSRALMGAANWHKKPLERGSIKRMVGRMQYTGGWLAVSSQESELLVKMVFALFTPELSKGGGKHRETHVE